MKRTRIVTNMGPSAIGPYSQAIVAGEMVFVSGQIPLDPATGKLIEGSIAVQTDRVMLNLKGILEAAGSSLEKVVKTTVFLTDLNDFEEEDENPPTPWPEARVASRSARHCASPLNMPGGKNRQT